MHPTLKSIDYKKELMEAKDIALFKESAMHAVAAEKGKTTFGYYIIIAGALLSFLGQQLFPAFIRPGLVFGLVMAVMQVVMAVIGIYALSYIAVKFFKGHAQHDQFFRVASYSMVVMWLSVLPQISLISGLWGLALIFVILKSVHKLTTGGAVGTIIVGIIAMMIISAITSPLYARFGGYGSFNSSMKNFNFSNGGNSVNLGDNTMTITNEKGEKVEIKVPNVNQ